MKTVEELKAEENRLWKELETAELPAKLARARWSLAHAELDMALAAQPKAEAQEAKE